VEKLPVFQRIFGGPAVDVPGLLETRNPSTRQSLPGLWKKLDVASDLT